jgi:hypothetical protein
MGATDVSGWIDGDAAARQLARAGFGYDELTDGLAFVLEELELA